MTKPKDMADAPVCLRAGAGGVASLRNADLTGADLSLPNALALAAWQVAVEACDAAVKPYFDEITSDMPAGDFEEVQARIKTDLRCVVVAKDKAFADLGRAEEALVAWGRENARKSPMAKTFEGWEAAFDHPNTKKHPARGQLAAICYKMPVGV